MPALDDCVFCGLLNGRLPASVVAEDAHVLAVMTIRPFQVGHVLLVPKAHVEDFARLDAPTRAHLFDVAARLKTAICTAVGCDDFQLLINQGDATGQKPDCRHLHVHLIPRRAGVPVDLGARYDEAPRAELDRTARAIARYLDV